MTADPLAPLVEAIRSAVQWLDEAGVPAAVVGGVAASLRGRPRVTKDVDFVALADLDACPALVQSAQRHGLMPRHDDVVEFARSTRVLLLVHDSGVEVDVSFGALPFERELVEASEKVSVAGAEFPLARAEDLVIMKALALRPRDVADIESVLTANPSLDVARVRTVVAHFAAILEEEDLLGELDRIISKVRPG